MPGARNELNNYAVSMMLAMVSPLNFMLAGSLAPARNSLFRCWYRAMASDLRPTFSGLILPSAVYRTHQIPEPGSFSYTPMCFFSALLAM